MSAKLFPPNRKALRRAHSQLNAATQHIAIGSPDLALARIKSVRNILELWLAASPEPLPKGPPHVS